MSLTAGRMTVPFNRGSLENIMWFGRAEKMRKPEGASKLMAWARSKR